jgi:phosphoesterase RecJ-like protein
MSQATIQAILNRIETAKSILVAAHTSPDGDALGSTLALTMALREMGKEVVAFNVDGIFSPFEFLPGSETIKNSLDSDQTFDLGFLLDAGELKRAGIDLRLHCTDLINIDHHPHSETFGVENFVDTEAAATAILIYRLLKQQQHAISLDVAINIYTATLSDTGSFRYSNTNKEAFTVAGEMVSLGINAWDIASRLYETQPLDRLTLLGEALRTLKTSTCGQYASIAVTSDMYERCHAGAEHTDGFVNYPRSIEGVEVSIFFRQTDPDRFKVGFRSKGNIDVGALARELGGGGHHNAAGAQVDGTLEQVCATVYNRLGTKPV